jgi:ABC-type uncharacterized transport system permease subunit
MTVYGWLFPLLTIAFFALATVYGYRGTKRSIALGAGFIIGVLLLAQTSLVTHVGWQVSMHESLLVALALVQVCYLLVSLSARSMWRLSLLVQPVLGLVFLLDLCMPANPQAVLILTPVLAVHIGGALVGYGFLTLSAFAAFAVYTREAYLKAHSASGFSTRLPVLEAADKGQFAALTMGGCCTGCGFSSRGNVPARPYRSVLRAQY